MSDKKNYLIIDDDVEDRETLRGDDVRITIVPSDQDYIRGRSSDVIVIPDDLSNEIRDRTIDPMADLGGEVVEVPQ